MTGIGQPVRNRIRQVLPSGGRMSRPAMWLGSALLFVGLTLGGLLLVSTFFGGSLPRFDPRLFTGGALAAMAGFLLVYFAADGLRLWFVLRSLGARVRLVQIVPLVFINLLFSNITPLATGGGFAQVVYLQRRGVPVGTSAAATTIRTIIAMLAIFCAAPLFQILNASAAAEEIGRGTLQSIAVVIALYLAGFLVLLRRPFWISGAVSRGLGLMVWLHLLRKERRDRWSEAVRRETAEFANSFSRFLSGSRRHAIGAVLATLTFLLTLFSFPALLLMLLDYDVNWLLVIGTLAVVTFLMYFAPTPGGAGFAELAFAGFMAGRIDSADLLLVIFAWRFLTIYLGMGIGLVLALVSVGRLGAGR